MERILEIKEIPELGGEALVVKKHYACAWCSIGNIKEEFPWEFNTGIFVEKRTAHAVMTLWNDDIKFPKEVFLPKHLKYIVKKVKYAEGSFKILLDKKKLPRIQNGDPVAKLFKNIIIGVDDDTYYTAAVYPSHYEMHARCRLDLEWAGKQLPEELVVKYKVVEIKPIIL